MSSQIYRSLLATPIVVPRVGVVYILGRFKTQGAIPLQQNSPMTLMKVTALAGGQLYPGKPDELRIIRTTGLTRQVVRVDLKKVINGQAPDPVLQAEDIVFLPTSLWKAAISSGGITTLLGIVSVLILAVQQIVEGHSFLRVKLEVARGPTRYGSVVVRCWQSIEEQGKAGLSGEPSYSVSGASVAANCTRA